MSNPLAIAAVTETLRSIVSEAVIGDAKVDNAHVTAAPPDSVPVPSANQLNVFLYQTAIDAAWRNEEPAGSEPGEPGPTLPLVLSYLLTAYGENDDDRLAHRLLGLAMAALHRRPLLSAAAVAAAYPGSELELQLERVRIAPQAVSLEEISRLWATFNTGYRVSATYEASVVLIDSGRPATSALPVLRRSGDDMGPRAAGLAAAASAAPQLHAATLPLGLPVVRPRGEVVLNGSGLGGVSAVQLTHAATGTSLTLARLERAGEDRDHAVAFAMPTPAQFPAGQASVLVVTNVAGTMRPVGEPLALAVAPTIRTVAPQRVPPQAAPASIDVACDPPVQPGQPIALVVGDRVIPGERGAQGTAARANVTFEVPALQTGSYTLRLRVEGVDSVPLRADASSPLPGEFDPKQRLVVA
jgi:hypothetical protein